MSTLEQKIHEYEKTGGHYTDDNGDICLGDPRVLECRPAPTAARGKKHPAPAAAHAAKMAAHLYDDADLPTDITPPSPSAGDAAMDVQYNTELPKHISGPHAAGRAAASDIQSVSNDSAIRKIQGKLGVDIDGKVGPKTRAALTKHFHSSNWKSHSWDELLLIIGA